MTAGRAPERRLTAQVERLLMLDLYPFNSPFVRRFYDRVLLPAWFIATAASLIFGLSASPGSFLVDLRLYRLAAQAWLEGGNPWVVTVYFNDSWPQIAYAGPPQTLLPFVVLAWVPEQVISVAYVLLASTAAIWTLRKLRLPMWWLLFPPILQGLWVGNVNIFVVALLVAGGSVAGAVAATLKVYSVVPLVLLRRWQAVLLVVPILIVTAPLLPWGPFLGDAADVVGRLSQQSWGGKTGVLGLPAGMMLGVVGLILVGRERAAWLAIPLVWPATQLHYYVLGLPAMTPALAAFACVEAPGVLAIGVILVALWERRWWRMLDWRPRDVAAAVRVRALTRRQTGGTRPVHGVPSGSLAHPEAGDSPSGVAGGARQATGDEP